MIFDLPIAVLVLLGLIVVNNVFDRRKLQRLQDRVEGLEHEGRELARETALLSDQTRERKATVATVDKRIRQCLHCGKRDRERYSQFCGSDCMAESIERRMGPDPNDHLRAPAPRPQDLPSPGYQRATPLPETPMAHRPKSGVSTSGSSVAVSFTSEDPL